MKAHCYKALPSYLKLGELLIEQASLNLGQNKRGIGAFPAFSKAYVSLVVTTLDKLCSSF
jgi:hypothetical protein